MKSSQPRRAAMVALASLLWSGFWWFAAMFGGDGDGAIVVGLTFTLVPLAAVAVGVSFTGWPVRDKRIIQLNLIVPSVLYALLMIVQLLPQNSAQIA